MQMYNKWSLNIFSELYIFTYQQDMYSKTGKKNLKSKTEELLQPQNKAKQHSLRVYRPCVGGG